MPRFLSARSIDVQFVDRVDDALATFGDDDIRPWTGARSNWRPRFVHPYRRRLNDSPRSANLNQFARLQPIVLGIPAIAFLIENRSMPVSHEVRLRAQRVRRDHLRLP